MVDIHSDPPGLLGAPEVAAGLTSPIARCAGSRSSDASQCVGLVLARFGFGALSTFAWAMDVAWCSGVTADFGQPCDGSC
jgi:hypothetical protein